MLMPVIFFLITLWLFTSLVHVASLLYNWFLNRQHRETTSRSSGCDSALLLQGAWIQSLVGELRSHMLCVVPPLPPQNHMVRSSRILLIKNSYRMRFCLYKSMSYYKINVIVHKSNWKNINNTFTNTCKTMLNRHHFYKWFFGKVLSIWLHWVRPPS